jgi:hypothetical protein
MLRSNLLFVHVISAMGVFATLGMETLALMQIRRATDITAARTALGTLGAGQRVGGPSIVVLLLSGFYLATAFWHWKGAWIGLGFLGLVLIAAVGGLMTARTVGRLRKALETGGEIAAVQQAHPTLRTSFAARLTLLIAVVYLMTVKPG